mmetsp:Transcript_24505/g.82287  ORF Transcript_24505/g.82287 Transcript_24505/m.82287 type:complete len:322 (-) Transcript_24505:864-1829(-)
MHCLAPGARGRGAGRLLEAHGPKEEEHDEEGEREVGAPRGLELRELVGREDGAPHAHGRVRPQVAPFANELPVGPLPINQEHVGAHLGGDEGHGAHELAEGREAEHDEDGRQLRLGREHDEGLRLALEKNKPVSAHSHAADPKHVAVGVEQVGHGAEHEAAVRGEALVAPRPRRGVQGEAREHRHGAQHGKHGDGRPEALEVHRVPRRKGGRHGGGLGPLGAHGGGGVLHVQHGGQEAGGARVAHGEPQGEPPRVAHDVRPVRGARAARAAGERVHEVEAAREAVVEGRGGRADGYGAPRLRGLVAVHAAGEVEHAHGHRK